MEMDLSPKLAQEVFSGEGGSYYSWSSSEYPILGEAMVGAGKLILEPLGFALPHYADSGKIGYVIEGSATIGMIMPGDLEEKVVRLKKGDTIPIPLGSLSWWFNDGDSQFITLFLGETSKAHTPGEFNYFFIAGALGLLNGFSTNIVSRAFNLNEEEANKIVKSQTGLLIIKLNEGINMPKPRKEAIESFVYNIATSKPDFDVENGGKVVSLTREKIPLLEEIGLSASLVRLNGNALLSPGYFPDSAVQVIYIVKGSGKVEIVGINGNNVLNTIVKANQLFVVPKFFWVSIIADDEGMEWFSIITKTKFIFNQLAGKKSIWKALSPQVVVVSLNVEPQLEKLFLSNMNKNTTFFPPPCEMGHISNSQKFTTEST